MAVVRTDPFDFRAPFPLDLRNRRADLNGRNSIEINARWPGMLVWVDSERVLYVLDSGEGDKGDNDRWRQVYPATNIDKQNVTFLTDIAPTGGADGDISFVDNTGDSVVEVWYRVTGTWTMLGQWSYGGGAATSSLLVGTDPVINWNVTAVDSEGNPVPDTWAQLYGNTPSIQVWLEVSANNYSLEAVPVTMTLSGGNIQTVNIDTSGISARIIIK